MDVEKGQPCSYLYDGSVNIPKTVKPSGRNRIESNREELRETEKSHLIRYPLGLYSRKTRTEMITIEEDDSSGSSRGSSVTNLQSYHVVARNKDGKFFMPIESSHHFLVRESLPEGNAKRKTRGNSDDEDEDDHENAEEDLECNEDVDDTPNQTEDEEVDEEEVAMMQDALKKVTFAKSKNKASNATKNKIPKTKEKQQELLARVAFDVEEQEISKENH